MFEAIQWISLVFLITITPACEPDPQKTIVPSHQKTAQDIAIKIHKSIISDNAKYLYEYFPSPQDIRDASISAIRNEDLPWMIKNMKIDLLGCIDEVRSLGNTIGFSWEKATIHRVLFNAEVGDGVNISNWQDAINICVEYIESGKIILVIVPLILGKATKPFNGPRIDGNLIASIISSEHRGFLKDWLPGRDIIADNKATDILIQGKASKEFIEYIGWQYYYKRDKDSIIFNPQPIDGTFAVRVEFENNIVKSVQRIIEKPTAIQ